MSKSAGFAIAPNQPNSVALPPTRRRLSLFTFGMPLLWYPNSAPRKPGPFFEFDLLDQEQLVALHDAGVDDLSLVYTMAFDNADDSGKKVAMYRDGAINPEWMPSLRWSAGFAVPPGKPADFQAHYLDQLVGALRDADPPIQLLLGYAAGPTREEDYARFLSEASRPQIEHHAGQIAAWCAKYDADGVSFDIEMDGLGMPKGIDLSSKEPADQEKIAKAKKHVADVRTRIQWLYACVAGMLAPHGRIVTYATGPFSTDGLGYSPFESQPYALIAGVDDDASKPAQPLPNTIARPMCYQDRAFSPAVINGTVPCAFRKVKEGGGGLNPSQLQLAIPTESAEQYCKDLLRGHDVGLVVYRLWPQKADTMKVWQGGEWVDTPVHWRPLEVIASCKKFNGLLNGKEDDPENDDSALRPGRASQPLQAPNGYYRPHGI
jgi:hypothetical protein